MASLKKVGSSADKGDKATEISGGVGREQFVLVDLVGKSRQHFRQRSRFDARLPTKALPLGKLLGVGCELIRQRRRQSVRHRRSPPLKRASNRRLKNRLVKIKYLKQNLEIVEVLHATILNASLDKRLKLFGHRRFGRIPP